MPFLREFTTEKAIDFSLIMSILVLQTKNAAEASGID